MQPLLKIQSVPISISYTTKRAQLQQRSQQPRAQVTRTRGRSDIKTNPAKIKIDSYEMRASMGIKTAPRNIEEFAQTGRADAVQATKDQVDRGNQITDSRGKGGDPISEMATSRIMSNFETIMTFMPNTRPQMWMEGGTIEFDYSPDRLDYDWQLMQRPDLEYIPGGVEFTVSQYPEVIFEYLGAPIYAPPSADPNYEPPPNA